MKRISQVLSMVVLMLLNSCSTQFQMKAQNSHMELNAKSGQISVNATKSTFSESFECKAASSWRWGAENKCPGSYISSMVVNIDNNPVFIPLSAFADLGNPREIRMETYTEKRFAIILIGGDAATSYTAKLDFSNGVLIERMVSNNEFPDNAWEKTRYKFNYN